MAQLIPVGVPFAGKQRRFSRIDSQSFLYSCPNCFGLVSNLQMYCVCGEGLALVGTLRGFQANGVESDSIRGMTEIFRDLLHRVYASRDGKEFYVEVAGELYKASYIHIKKHGAQTTSIIEWKHGEGG